MNSFSRFTCGLIAAITIAGTVVAPIAASAQDEQGRKNLTLGLGAVTGYLFTRGGNKTGAFIGAAATGYSYKRYQDSVNARHKRERLNRQRKERHAAAVARHQAAVHHRNAVKFAEKHGEKHG